MADCVLPTRNARHGSVWINSNNQHSPDLQINLKNKQYESDFQPIEPGCDCYACSNNFTRAWFRHQFKVGEPLAGAMASVHNIRYLMRIAEEFQKK
jgi:queuine tRNA-ribosyltransferase